MKYSSILLSIFLLLSFFLTRAHYIDLVDENKTELSNLSKLYAERMQNVIQDVVKDTNLLKEIIIANEGMLEDEIFPILSKFIYDKNKYAGISFQPQGIITEYFSENIASNLIGKNAFELEATQKAAKEAFETKETKLSGPYSILGDKQLYIAVRTPVFFDTHDKERFWGFIVIPIYSSYLLKQIGISALLDIDFGYSIKSTYQGELSELSRTQNFVEDDYTYHHNFELSDAQWSISISKNDIKSSMYEESLLIGLAFLFMFLCFYLIVFYFERQGNIMKKLAILDPLTKLKNRKALEFFIDEIEKNKLDSYTLFYIDLNLFKPVNDTYGHEVGDKLLIAFSERLKGAFKKNTFIARVGGDEFLIILKEYFDKARSEQMIKRIINVTEAKFIINDIEINISASIGYAAYPQDAETYTEAQDLADKRMQKYKEENKKGR